MGDSTSDPDITWLNPEGEPLSSEGEISIVLATPPGDDLSTRLTTYALNFSPLHTSRGGTYTCEVTVTSPFETLREMTSTMFTVIVESKTVVIKLLQHPMS